MAFRWRGDDGPLIVVFGSSLPLSQKKKEQLDPPDKTFWIRAWIILSVSTGDTVRNEASWLSFAQPKIFFRLLAFTRLRVYKTFSMLNSAENEIYSAHKC